MAVKETLSSNFPPMLTSSMNRIKISSGSPVSAASFLASRIKSPIEIPKEASIPAAASAIASARADNPNSSKRFRVSCN